MASVTITMQLLLVTISCILVLPAAMAENDHKIRQTDSECPQSYPSVYPYGAHCTLPARFFTEEFHMYQSTSLKGLGPEWSDDSSTYYLRLAASSATYAVLYNRTAAGDFVYENVYQNFPTLLQNTESQRYLGWKEEADGQHYLVERSNMEEAATFWFSKNEAASSELPCISLPGIRCEAYLVRSLPPRTIRAASGLLLSASEDGVNYIKLAPVGAIGDIPILLHRVSSSLLRTSNKM